jgi:drug/metabolite transporter (DMT)-like permease
VNPVVAFILAAILLGEELSPRTVIAAAVIVAAVALIITARGRETEPTLQKADIAAADEAIRTRPVPSERSVEPAP